MARKRSYTLFVVINVLVSLAVAALAIVFYSSTRQEEPESRALPTLIVFVTATHDPNLLPAAALQSTVDSQAGTISALEREIAIIPTNDPEGGNIPEQPEEEGESGSTGSTQTRTESDLPTLDPSLIPPLPTISTGAGGSSALQASTDVIPEDGCERYSVQSGDTASSIATDQGVSLSELFVLNGINDQTVLQIGDELLIPGEACEPEVPPTITPTPRPTFNLTFVAPTVTIAPITGESQVELVQILNPGDITSEQVEIRNNGGQINLLGWKLSDSDGNVYTFPEVRLVPGSVIRISTRTGNNTAGFLYWNLNTPVWEDGETATLSNAANEPQSVINVGGEIIDFEATDVP